MPERIRHGSSEDAKPFSPPFRAAPIEAFGHNTRDKSLIAPPTSGRRIVLEAYGRPIVIFDKKEQLYHLRHSPSRRSTSRDLVCVEQAYHPKVAFA